MARLAGFEPTTPWFVAKYSIQLSYSRAKPMSIAQKACLSREPARGSNTRRDVVEGAAPIRTMNPALARRSSAKAEGSRYPITKDET